MICLQKVTHSRHNVPMDGEHGVDVPPSVSAHRNSHDPFFCEQAQANDDVLMGLICSWHAGGDPQEARCAHGRRGCVDAPPSVSPRTEAAMGSLQLGAMQRVQTALRHAQAYTTHAWPAGGDTQQARRAHGRQGRRNCPTLSVAAHRSSHRSLFCRRLCIACKEHSGMRRHT